jgi:hypothetical protein
MDTLVTKNSNDWLIICKNKTHPLFLSRQLFARYIIQRYLSLKPPALKTEALLSGMTLEYLYPLCCIRSDVFNRIITRNYSISKYYTTNLSFIHNHSLYFPQRRFFQIGKQNRIVKSDKPGDVALDLVGKSMKKNEFAKNFMVLKRQITQTLKTDRVVKFDGSKRIRNIEKNLTPPVDHMQNTIGKLSQIEFNKVISLVHTSNSGSMYTKYTYHQTGARDNDKNVETVRKTLPVLQAINTGLVIKSDRLMRQIRGVDRKTLPASMVLQRYQGSKEMTVFSNRGVTSLRSGPEPFPYYKQSSHMPELEYSYLNPKIVSSGSISAQTGETEKEKTQAVTYYRKESPPKIPGLYQGESAMDINILADQVYQVIEKKMQIERERSGRWY